MSFEMQPMSVEDVQDHYIGLLVKQVEQQGDKIDKDTLIMFCAASMARSLEYIEYRLVQIQSTLEKGQCKQ